MRNAASGSDRPGVPDPRSPVPVPVRARDHRRVVRLAALLTTVIAVPLLFVELLGDDASNDVRSPLVSAPTVSEVPHDRPTSGPPKAVAVVTASTTSSTRPITTTTTTTTAVGRP